MLRFPLLFCLRNKTSAVYDGAGFVLFILYVITAQLAIAQSYRAFLTP
jgi:hypothetical protein